MPVTNIFHSLRLQLGKQYFPFIVPFRGVTLTIGLKEGTSYPAEY